MADHAVGSKISLISKSDIRYEGFLHFINPDENTVGLKNVRMFGTEGRKGGANEVAAGDQLYEFIIFRGGDIKDLTVYEDRPRDPAIVSATPAAAPARQEPRQQTYAERAGAKPRADERKDDRFERRPDRYDRPAERRDDHRFEHRDNRFEHRDNRFERRPDNRDNRDDRQVDRRDDRFERRPNHSDDRRRDDRRDGGYTASRGRGGYNDRRDNRDSRDHHVQRDNRDSRDNRDDRRRDAPQGSGRGGRGNFGGGAPRPRPNNFGNGAPRPEAHTGRDFVVATGEAKEQFKEEFDFSKSKEAFEQKKNEFEKAKDDARAAARAYDKSSSFFDNISCETKEPKGPRMDREETKKADTETFGSDMVGSIRGFRRGRGGRGRYGGRF